MNYSKGIEHTSQMEHLANTYRVVQIFYGLAKKLLLLSNRFPYIFEVVVLLPCLQDVDILVRILFFKPLVALLPDLCRGNSINFLASRESSKFSFYVLREIGRVAVPKVWCVGV